MLAQHQPTVRIDTQSYGICGDWQTVEGQVTHRASSGSVLRFRQFSILPGARLLLAGNTAVPIGSRAFDLLVVLTQARGTVVPKESIIQQVWPSTIVEESNLRFQMACLRKALGCDRDLIKTIPGRGYLLAADVDEWSPHIAAPGAAPAWVALDPAWQSTHGDAAPGHIRESSGPTVVLFGEDDLMRERVQALLRLVGLQVQLFGSVSAFLKDIRASA